LYKKIILGNVESDLMLTQITKAVDLIIKAYKNEK